MTATSETVLPPTTAPPGTLPAGLAWALLVTSIAWTGLSLALAINAWHAQALGESLRNYASVKFASLCLGSVMGLAGMIGAAMAVNEMKWARSSAARFIAAWIWTVTLCIALGSMRMFGFFSHWPWLQMTVGSSLAIVGYVTVSLLRRRRSRAVATD